MKKGIIVLIVFAVFGFLFISSKNRKTEDKKDNTKIEGKSEEKSNDKVDKKEDNKKDKNFSENSGYIGTNPLAGGKVYDEDFEEPLPKFVGITPINYVWNRKEKEKYKKIGIDDIEKHLDRLLEGKEHIRTDREYIYIYSAYLANPEYHDTLPKELFYEASFSSEYAKKNYSRDQIKEMFEKGRKNMIENINNFSGGKGAGTFWYKLTVGDVDIYRVNYKNRAGEKDKIIFKLVKVDDYFDLFPDLDYIIAPIYFDDSEISDEEGELIPALMDFAKMEFK